MHKTKLSLRLLLYPVSLIGDIWEERSTVSGLAIGPKWRQISHLEETGRVCFEEVHSLDRMSAWTMAEMHASKFWRKQS